MALSMYNGTRRFNARPLFILMSFNAGFAAMVLFAWTVISVLVAEPISWATWAPLSVGSQPDLIDYPFILLWGLPTLGILVAWVAKNLRKHKLAYLAVAAPMAILSMVFTYFYFVPLQYH